MDWKSFLKTFLVVFLISGVFVAFSMCRQPAELPASQNTETNVVQVAEKSAQPEFTQVSSGNEENDFVYETDLLKVTFTTKGAAIKSILLKELKNNGEPSELIFNPENEGSFMLYWGAGIKNPVDGIFDVEQKDNKVIFSAKYVSSENKEVNLTKTFEFRNGEYLFRVFVETDAPEVFNGGKFAYTLAFGPQVGPEFSEIKNNAYDYRRVYVGLAKNGKDAKKQPVNLSKGSFVWEKIDDKKNVDWISLTGKYFTVVALPKDPDVNNYRYIALQKTEKDSSIPQQNNIGIAVPAEDSAKFETFFYCGPQLKNIMGRYYNASGNAWNVSNLNLDEAAETGNVLIAWLENLLAWALKVLNKLVANYGVDIILLTVILKVILWPLTAKSTSSTAKMTKLQPMLKEIQDKYANDQQKLNEATMALYKKYGISPMGGCLPLLLQFPILIAFYGLLNRHIELRGQMFIPGWIVDLSVPDNVLKLPFRIPLLNSYYIHLLPILYTASMIVSMKISQGIQANKGNKQPGGWFMTWGMSVIFFFLLYNAPSGLFVYWITQNILSVVQQVIVNKKYSKAELVPVALPENKKEKKNGKRI